jgi:hypothetical protein
MWFGTGIALAGVFLSKNGPDSLFGDIVAEFIDKILDSDSS